MNIESGNYSIKTDTLYFVIIGDKKTIYKMINIINKENPLDNYIMSQLNIPVAKQSIEIMKSTNDIEDDDMLNSLTQKTVLIDDGVEFAQGHIYADGNYNDESYMIQMLIDNKEHYVLSFPNFLLYEDVNPERIIEDWFKKNFKRVPSDVKKNTKLVTVAGEKSNILVVRTDIKKL